MRRSPASLLLTVLLLAGCAGDPSSRADRGPETSSAPRPSGSAGPAGAGGSGPDIEGLVLADEELSRKHQDGRIEYEQVPPMGGPHNPRWLACDVYDEPVPAEVAVHSLEHGAVWFTYAPDLPQDEVDRLADLAGKDKEYVLVSPLQGLDSRIVAVAWGASLEASSADDPRLEQFLEAYAGGNQGGEGGALQGNGLSLREATGLLENQA